MLDDYLGDEVAQDRIFEPEVASQPQQEIHVPSELLSIEESEERTRADQDSVEINDALVIEDADVPIVMLSSDVHSHRNPFESARIELQFALVSIHSDRELALALDALRRARTIASTSGLSPSVIRSVEQALAELDQLSAMNFASIQDGLDRLSELVVSIGSIRNEGASGSEPDTSFYVSEETESQSFWNELSDGISNVYRVRRIDGSTPKPKALLIETSAQLRLMVMLERARNDIRMYDFDSYRATISEAIAIVDSLSQENTEALNSIKDELLDLVNLELTSPHASIRAALRELTNEAAIQTIESTAMDQ